MKKLFFKLFFLLTSALCDAQSFLGINIGLDYSQIQEVKSDHPSAGDLWIPNKDYSAKSLSFGISGEQHLSKSISVVINLSYTKKNFEAYYGDFISTNSMKYKFLGGSLLFNYYPCKYAYFGGGLSMNYLSDVKVYYKNGDGFPLPIQTYKKYGFNFLGGLKYMNFFLEPQYILGFDIRDKTEFRDLKPINSFRISLGYKIRVSKRKK